MNKTITATTLALAAGLASGFVLTGSATPGTVEACYRTTNGALRVDTGGGCKGGEQALTLGTGRITTRVVTDEDSMSRTDQGVLEMMCAPGEVVTGGGYTIASIGPDIFVNQDQPFQDDDGNQGWLVVATYTTVEDYVVEVWGYAICTAGVTTEAPWLEG